jgi:DNA-binding CsgD family transcriptional regulator
MAVRQTRSIKQLSPRERQVMGNRVLLGMPYKSIADRMGLSIHTVKQHAGNAFAKLGVRSSLEAALVFPGRN